MPEQRHVLLGILLVIVPVGWGADGVGQRTSRAPGPAALTPAQLLDRYETTQRRIYRSFVSGFESDNQGYINRHTVLEPGWRRGREVVEIRSDGRRYFWSEERSGQCFPRLSETTPVTDPRVKWFLYDGQHYYSAGHEPLWMIRQAAKRHKTNERSQAFHDQLSVAISDRLDPKSEFVHHFGIGASPHAAELPDSLGTGGLFMETGLVLKMRKAQTLALEPMPEPVGGVACPVLKASWSVTTDARGQKHTAEYVCRLHFDPGHDYQIARMEVTITRRDLAGEQKIPGPYLVEKRTMDNVRFQQIGEAGVPMEWQRSYSARRLDNPQLYQWETNKVRRTRLLLNPDHDALGSFKPTWIQDGWIIHLRGFGSRFDHAGPLAWKQGQVVDKAGQRVDLR